MAKQRVSKHGRKRNNAFIRMVADDAMREVLVEMFGQWAHTIRTSDSYVRGIHEGKRELALWFIQQCHTAERECGLRMLSAITGGVETWQQEPSTTQAQDPEQKELEESPEERLQ